MNVEFTNRFEKQFDQIKDEKLRAEISKLVRVFIQADSIREIQNVKKLKGYKTAYRIRLGNYRTGFIYYGSSAIFSAFAHRKDIYKQFP